MLAEDAFSRGITVNDILFTQGDDDDDLPIAATLHALPKAGSVEVQAKKTRKNPKKTLHAQPKAGSVEVQAKKTIKKPKKTLWSYELVTEPTGIASKYWDANAPGERATKVLANERLTELHLGEDEVEQQPQQLQPEVELQPQQLQPEVEQQPQQLPPTKKAKRTQVAARTAQERRADLKSFTEMQRLKDNAVTTAQVTKAPSTASNLDASVENETPARVPLPCKIPPAGEEAIGTLIASEFPGYAPVV
jgi:hypothetical protein